MPNDSFAVRAVTIVLGIVSVIGVCGLVLLGYTEKDIPVELVGVTTGAVGAMSGLLASTRSAPADQSGGLR